MRSIVAGFLLVISAGCSTEHAGDESTYSNISDDEVVVFFRKMAWVDSENDEWHIPVHGWIYEPQDSVSRKTVFATVLRNEFGLEANAKTEANFSRRLNLLIADNERGKTIVVEVAGTTFTLAPSSVNGHFQTVLRIPVEDVEEFRSGDSLPIHAVTARDETRRFSGEVFLTEAEGLSVISDIDDTVKISKVTERRSLLEHTFLLDFMAVPGMAELYKHWSDSGARFHFVSSSPWQLYEPLTEFLDAHEFPRAELSLKAVRFRDKTLFDLFKKGTETKPDAINAILARYPERKFVLVGDSGEQDPEVYAQFIREHPEQILKVYIRNVTGESQDNDRFTAAFDGIEADCWQLFDEPAGLSLRN